MSSHLRAPTTANYPHNGNGNQMMYELESGISTEEAFFQLNDLKSFGRTSALMNSNNQQTTHPPFRKQNTHAEKRSSNKRRGVFREEFESSPSGDTGGNNNASGSLEGRGKRRQNQFIVAGGASGGGRTSQIKGHQKGGVSGLRNSNMEESATGAGGLVGYNEHSNQNNGQESATKRPHMQLQKVDGQKDCEIGAIYSPLYPPSGALLDSGEKTGGQLGNHNNNRGGRGAGSGVGFGKHMRRNTMRQLSARQRNNQHNQQRDPYTSQNGVSNSGSRQNVSRSSPDQQSALLNLTSSGNKHHHNILGALDNRSALLTEGPSKRQKGKGSGKKQRTSKQRSDSQLTSSQENRTPKYMLQTEQRHNMLDGDFFSALKVEDIDNKDEQRMNDDSFTQRKNQLLQESQRNNQTELKQEMIPINASNKNQPPTSHNEHLDEIETKNFESSEEKRQKRSTDHSSGFTNNLPRNTSIGRLGGGGVVVTQGQSGLKVDMHFGWKPDLQNSVGGQKAEAIAIKLKYPDHKMVVSNSVRASHHYKDVIHEYNKTRSNRRNVNEIREKFQAKFRPRVVYQGYRPSLSIDVHLKYGQKTSLINEESTFYDVQIPQQTLQKMLTNTNTNQKQEIETPRCPLSSHLKNLNLKAQQEEIQSAQITATQSKNASSKTKATTASINNNCGNPSDIAFESMFESGNLDLVIQVQPNEYNLYLKPDTNTKGFCNWFFFKIRRVLNEKAERLKRKKIHFNIMNMYKKKILFRHEATPLACFSEIHRRGFVQMELETSTWTSKPFSNVTYAAISNKIQNLPEWALHPDDRQNNSLDQPGIGGGTSTTRPYYSNPYSNSNSNSQSNNQNQNRQQQNQSGMMSNMLKKSQKFFVLCFDFEFAPGQESAYIAQSIPYPYTFLQRTIRQTPKLARMAYMLSRSLSGLFIPALTITNDLIPNDKKHHVIISGRVHPGETNSSWVIHGVIEFLLSKESAELRDKLIFKIVPMINADGVVAGNYRTSFIGKDLNRLYLQEDPEDPKYALIDDLLKPEIVQLQKMITGCQKDNSRGVLAFIDVHHHSQKRGAFMFGPQHAIQSQKFNEVRVLPKLLSMLLDDVFRYQACKFKNHSYKETCARLYCEKELGITHSFCLEVSQQGYFTRKSGGESHRQEGRRGIKYFDQNSMMLLGRKLCEAILILADMTSVQDEKRALYRKKRARRNIAKLMDKKGGQKSGMLGGGSALKSGKHKDQHLADCQSMNSFESSQPPTQMGDFFVDGKIDPKVGLKSFIKSVIQRDKQLIRQSSSRNSLSRTGTSNKRNVGPLTELGEADAVSEKSSKFEESSSEDGSGGGSSCQNLSDEEQDAVLADVLDLLDPERKNRHNLPLPRLIEQPQTPAKIIPIAPKKELLPEKKIVKKPVLMNPNFRVQAVQRKFVYKQELLVSKPMDFTQQSTATTQNNSNMVNQACQNPNSNLLLGLNQQSNLPLSPSKNHKQLSLNSNTTQSRKISAISFQRSQNLSNSKTSKIAPKDDILDLGIAIVPTKSQAPQGVSGGTSQTQKSNQVGNSSNFSRKLKNTMVSQVDIFGEQRTQGANYVGNSRQKMQRVQTATGVSRAARNKQSMRYKPVITSPPTNQTTPAQTTSTKTAAMHRGSQLIGKNGLDFSTNGHLKKMQASFMFANSTPKQSTSQVGVINNGVNQHNRNQNRIVQPQRQQNITHVSNQNHPQQKFQEWQQNSQDDHKFMLENFNNDSLGNDMKRLDQNQFLSFEKTNLIENSQRNHAKNNNLMPSNHSRAHQYSRTSQQNTNQVSQAADQATYSNFRAFHSHNPSNKMNGPSSRFAQERATDRSRYSRLQNIQQNQHEFQQNGTFKGVAQQSFIVDPQNRQQHFFNKRGDNQTNKKWFKEADFMKTQPMNQPQEPVHYPLRSPEMLQQNQALLNISRKSQALNHKQNLQTRQSAAGRPISQKKHLDIKIGMIKESSSSLNSPLNGFLSHQTSNQENSAASFFKNDKLEAAFLNAPPSPLIKQNIIGRNATRSQAKSQAMQSVAGVNNKEAFQNNVPSSKQPTNTKNAKEENQQFVLTKSSKKSKQTGQNSNKKNLKDGFDKEEPTHNIIQLKQNAQKVDECNGMGIGIAQKSSSIKNEVSQLKNESGNGVQAQQTNQTTKKAVIVKKSTAGGSSGNKTKIVRKLF